MGHPKKQRKKYDTPKKPYDKERIEKEKRILKEYGLQRKKEIWRFESMLRNFRRRARELQALHDEKKEKDLIEKVDKMGVGAGKDSKLEDILGLNIESIMERRLQTILFKKGMANTIKHARQIIVHGHVRVDGRKVPYPGYIVTKNKEDKIKLDDKIKVKTQ